MTENSNLNPNQNTEKAIKTSHFSVTYSNPFGMPMPNRTYSLSSSKYRFGFNTQEKDDEVYGAGNLYSAQFWEYDTRIGRRWNVDPIVKVCESPYAVNGGNPIAYNDPNGDDMNGTINPSSRGGNGSGGGIKLNFLNNINWNKVGSFLTDVLKDSDKLNKDFENVAYAYKKTKSVDVCAKSLTQDEKDERKRYHEFIRKCNSKLC